MKASELMERLQREINANGDLNVRIICDHGQVLMSPFSCSMGYIEDDTEFMGEEVDPDDEPDATRVIIIDG